MNNCCIIHIQSIFQVSFQRHNYVIIFPDWQYPVMSYLHYCTGIYKSFSLQAISCLETSTSKRLLIVFGFSFFFKYLKGWRDPWRQAEIIASTFSFSDTVPFWQDEGENKTNQKVIVNLELLQQFIWMVGYSGSPLFSPCRCFHQSWTKTARR